VPPIQQRFWTKDKLADCLVMGGGRIADACRIGAQKYGHKLVRSTFYAAFKTWPDLGEVGMEIRDTHCDNFEKSMVDRAYAGSARDQRFLWSKYKPVYGQPYNRGAIAPPKKIELTGADGAPVQHQEVIADGEVSLRKHLRTLPFDEIVQLLGAVKVANGNVNRSGNAQ
jgi:hypothetical protein